MGLSARKAAPQLGISHVALLKAHVAGRVPREPDGSFDVDACRMALQQNSNPTQQRNARAQQHHARAEQQQLHATVEGSSASAEPSQNSQAEAERQLAWLKVREKERADRQRAGELLEREAIENWARGIVIRARDALLLIGPELQDDLALERDPFACGEMVTRRIHAALRKLAEEAGQVPAHADD
jgi:hypothetical protein